MQCHIVTIFVNIHLLANAPVNGILIGLLTQFIPFHKGIPGSTFLHITTVVVNDKKIYLILVQSVIGIDKMLVVGFTHIDKALIHTINVMYYGLVVLCINIYSTRQDKLLQEAVSHTVIGVNISTIADEQHFRFVEGLVHKKRIIHC